MYNTVVSEAVPKRGKKSKLKRYNAYMPPRFKLL